MLWEPRVDCGMIHFLPVWMGPPDASSRSTKIDGGGNGKELSPKQCPSSPEVEGGRCGRSQDHN